MKNVDVTGRDESIKAQALAYAIIAIQALPDEDQEWSNMADMCRLIRHDFNSNFARVIVGVEMHTNRILDLFPDREDFDAEATASAELQIAELGEHREERWAFRREAMALQMANTTGKSIAECRSAIDAQATNYPPAGHDKLEGVAAIAA